MKTVTYLDGIRQQPDMLPLAEKSTAQLEGIVRSFAPLISAEWDLVEEAGRPEVALRLADDTGSVTARFQPREMKNSEQMEHRLRGVWDNLLRERSAALLRGLEAKLSQYEGN